MIFRAFYKCGGPKYLQVEILANTDPAQEWAFAASEACRLGKEAGFELISLTAQVEAMKDFDKEEKKK